jgi:hypothetical protein
MRAVQTPREPSDRERELLNHVLSHGSETARSYLPQTDGIRVVRSCTCGCPSVTLHPLEGAPPGTAGDERVICDLAGVTASGESVGLLVFVDEGRLAELEIYPFGDFVSKSPDSNFPTLESLAPFGG